MNYHQITIAIHNNACPTSQSSKLNYQIKFLLLHHSCQQRVACIQHLLYLITNNNRNIVFNHFEGNQKHVKHASLCICHTNGGHEQRLT